MFINRLDLDNFGPFIDKRLENFSKELTVVLGPNESGKSAIRAFIRNILFGFLNRQNRQQFDFYNYPSIRGGNLSGSISVTSKMGETYRIHRTEGSSGGPVTVSGEGTGSLDSLIGGIDKDVYQNVFSISLTELQEFSTLNSGELRDRIYSSGLGIKVNLPGILNELKKESDGLLSATGRRGVIRDWLTELSDNKDKLDKVQVELVEYQNIGQIEEDIAKKVERSRSNLEELRSERLRLERLVELQEPWDSYVESQRQIGLLPDTKQFPIDGLNDYHALKSKQEKLEWDLSAGDAKKLRDLEAIDRLNITEAFVSRDGEIEKLMNNIGVYEGCERDLGDVCEALRLEELTIASGIQNLGSKWNRSKLSDEVNFEEAEKNLSDTGKSLTKLQGELNTLNSEVASGKRQQTDAWRKLPQGFDDMNEMRGESIETKQSLESRLTFLQSLQAVLTERQTIEQGIRGVNSQLASLTGLSRAQIQRWIPLSLVLLGTIFLIGTAISREVSGILAGFSIAAVGVVLFFRNQQQTLGNSPSDPAADLLGDKQSQLDEFERVESEIADILNKLELGTAPTLRGIIEEISKINKMIMIRTAFDELQTATGDLLETEAQATQKREFVEVVEKEWKDVLESLSLDSTLEPMDAANALGEIKILRIKEVNAKALRLRVEDMEKTMNGIESQLTPILEEAELPLFTAAHATSALNSLATKFKRHQDQLALKDSFQVQIKQWESKRDEILKSLEQAKSEMDELLVKANCADEEGFRNKGKSVTERNQLEIELNGLLRAQPLLGNEQGKPFRNELESSPPERIKARLEQIGADVDQAISKHEDCLSEAAAARIQRERMEYSNPTEDLQATLAELREKVDDAAGKWAVKVIAYEMLIQAREKYQREKQGPLLESASGYFRHFTKGRYTRIESVMGEERLRIVDADDKIKDAPSMLSRGTAEQLLLAMRFALIDEYSRKSEPMPVILDDVMVNFDPERAQATCDGIVKLSDRHQVILLTCNPETVSRIQVASEPLDKRPTVIEI